MDITRYEEEIEHKTEGLSDVFKVAAIAGVLGLTGVIAYCCRDGGALSSTKKSSGPSRRAQGPGPGATGTNPQPAQVYHVGDTVGQAVAKTEASVLTLGLANLFDSTPLSGSIIGILSANSAIRYLGEAPILAVDTAAAPNVFIPKSKVSGGRTTADAPIFNSDSGERISILPAGSTVSNIRSFSRASCTDSVTGIVTPVCWIQNDSVRWTGGSVSGGGGGGGGGVPEYDQVALQAAPEYATWRSQWGEHFWERPEWRSQYGERFERLDEAAIQGSPEYSTWHAQYGDRFWERPEWRSQYGEHFRSSHEDGHETGHESEHGHESGHEPGHEIGHGSGHPTETTGAYHHGQSWAATQAAETATRTAVQSGSAQHHQAAASAHQYAASSHQAAAALKPAQLQTPAAKALAASHLSAVASHQAAAQEHTTASKQPPGSPSAVQHGNAALGHAMMATQHAATAHQAGPAGVNPATGGPVGGKKNKK